MSERLVVSTGDADAGERLDATLSRHLDEHSRATLASCIRERLVTVDGEVVNKPAHRLSSGQEVVVIVPRPTPCTIEPEDIPLRVLYEDDDLLVVDKPAGMVVHPAHGHSRGTLVNALIGRDLAPAPADEPLKPGIVHRLDKDTSGCLVVARNAAARASLERQFRDREVGKTYLAVVHGAPPESGEIDSPVGRHARDRKRMSTRSRRGRAAHTRYRVVERFQQASLLEVVITTGRTHQIRVHLASIGHPVVGDRVYGGGVRGARGAAAAFPRQALHAAELQIRHPSSGRDLVFRALLPIDMEELVRSLRGPPGGRAEL